jgi:hypothetical protein
VVVALDIDVLVERSVVEIECVEVGLGEIGRVLAQLL